MQACSGSGSLSCAVVLVGVGGEMLVLPLSKVSGYSLAMVLVPKSGLLVENGDGAGGEDDTDGVVGTAVTAVGAVAVVECIGITVVGTRGRRGASDIGGAGLSVVKVKGVC